jgi:hypothetical protein
MSEKLPEPTRRGLRFEGMLGKLFPGIRRRSPYEFDEEAYRASRRERIDKIPAGPGLKEYDLDSNLFQYSTDMTDLTSGTPPFNDTFRKMLAEYREAQPSEIDDNDDANPFVNLMYSGEMLSRPSRELSAWLRDNTPQNGYFTPEMVEEVITDDPEFAIAKHSEDGLDFWHFSDTQGSAITLSRPSDGKRPSVQTRPYLSAHYWTEYDPDTEELVSTPRLSTNNTTGDEYSMFKRSDFANRLTQHLNLRPIRLPQKINFQVVGAKPAPYFTGADRESFESVIAQAHVEADFPKAA